MTSRPLLSAAVLAALLAGLAPCRDAAAQVRSVTPDGDEGDAGATRWGLGIAVGVERKPYDGIGNKGEVLPLILFENRYVRLFGPALDVKLPAAGPVSFTLRAKYSNDGYKESDAPILNGMDKREGELWLGGTATWHAGFADLSAEAFGGTTGGKGAQVKLLAEREFESGRFSFSPRVSATWYDRKVVDYYYGVKAEEARPGRPQYDGRSTVNGEVGLRTTYKLDRHQALLLDVGATALGSHIKDSPIVGRSVSSELRVGYLYRF